MKKIKIGAAKEFFENSIKENLFLYNHHWTIDEYIDKDSITRYSLYKEFKNNKFKITASEKNFLLIPDINEPNLRHIQIIDESYQLVYIGN